MTMTRAVATSIQAVSPPFIVRSTLPPRSCLCMTPRMGAPRHSMATLRRPGRDELTLVLSQCEQFSAPPAASPRAAGSDLAPGTLGGVRVQAHATIRLAATGARDEIGSLGHLVLEPPDVRVLR